MLITVKKLHLELSNLIAQGKGDFNICFINDNTAHYIDKVETDDSCRDVNLRSVEIDDNKGSDSGDKNEQ